MESTSLPLCGYALSVYLNVRARAPTPLRTDTHCGTHTDGQTDGRTDRRTDRQTAYTSRVYVDYAESDNCPRGLSHQCMHDGCGKSPWSRRSRRPSFICLHPPGKAYTAFLRARPQTDCQGRGPVLNKSLHARKSYWNYSMWAQSQYCRHKHGPGPPPSLSLCLSLSLRLCLCVCLSVSWCRDDRYGFDKQLVI